jgi:hypothetical protein
MEHQPDSRLSEACDGREWRQIADDVVVMSFPFRVFGLILNET